jgi:DNA-binding HxlR family transcriptional regulator
MMLRTAQQRKALCPSCPVARVADLLGDSCSILIVRDLLERPRRFGELQESLIGISSRTLTNKLKLLERECLIVHKKAGESPSRYALSKKGAAFNNVVEAMRRYGNRYL